MQRLHADLQGSTNIGGSRFRSPQEFFPHAEWLFDTSKPLSDHSQVSACLCPS